MGWGELLSLASAAAWAVGVILYRRLGARLAPLPLNFLKNLLVLAMLLPALALLLPGGLPKLSGQPLLLALASGFIGIAIADTLYFRALNLLGAGRMGIIGNSYSPFVILLSFGFLGERLTAWQLGGFALVSAGVWLVARTPGPQAAEGPPESPLIGRDGRAPARATRKPLGGVAIGLLAVLLMATAIVMVKRVLETEPLLTVTFWRLIGAIGGMLVLAALRGELRALVPRRAGIDWGTLVLAAFMGQFLAMLLWLAGYKYTQASVAAILNETASAFIVLLAWLWLGEPLGRRALAGVALTLGGVALMLVP